MNNSKRQESFDLLRLFFVFLALASHFRISQGTGYVLRRAAVLRSPSLLHLPYHITLTRSAMAALLVVFGFMIEFVYANIWQRKGARLVLEKMIKRALLCYFAYLAIAFIANYTDGNGSFKTLIGLLFFVSREHGNAFLFKYYTFLIPVVYVLMLLRFRFGWLTEVLLVSGLIILAEVIKTLTPDLPSPFTLLGENFFGIGNKIGPSVIHSLILVTFGGLAANFATTKKLSARTWIMIFLGVFSLVSVAFEINRVGFSQFVLLMASAKIYRATNSHVYFAFGILSFSFFWSISWFIMRLTSDRIKKWISYYGGNTFIIFLYGNIFLLFMPKVDVDSIAYPSILVSCLLFSLACVNFYYWASQNVKAVILYNRFIDSLVQKILSLFLRSAHLRSDL